MKILTSAIVGSLALSILTLSCVSTADADANYAPGSVATRNAVYEHLQEFGDIGLSTPRDSSYYPEAVLPPLHGWLQEGAGLRRVQVEGHTALLLAKIPPQVLQSLESVGFGDDYRSGFDLLQASFWKGIAELQKTEGLRFGFLEPDPNFKVSGVFFADKKVILFDVFASQGTFEHETHHYRQSVVLQSHESDDSFDEDDNNDGPLSGSCLEESSRFFAELDATTLELPNWIGVFKTLDVAPAWHRAGTQPADPVRFPQINLLEANLDYPGMAAQWVESQDCPSALVSAIAQIKTSTDRFESRMVHDDAIQLFGLRREDFNGWLYEHSRCSMQPQPSPESCAQTSVELSQVSGDALKISSEMDREFQAESQSRPQLIRQALASLPDDIQRQLCRHAQGYEFLTDCQRYF